MHTVEKGDISVAMLTACFLRKRFVVLKPVSEHSRYDLVIDRGTGFERVQCKTAVLRHGSIIFNACSIVAHKGVRGARSYRGHIDLFGVYCPATDACYLIPVNDVGKIQGYLRHDPPKKNNRRFRLASNYIILPT